MCSFVEPILILEARFEYKYKLITEKGNRYLPKPYYIG